jgi:hypothetical protein
MSVKKSQQLDINKTSSNQDLYEISLKIFFECTRKEVQDATFPLLKQLVPMRPTFRGLDESGLIVCCCCHGKILCAGNMYRVGRRNLPTHPLGPLQVGRHICLQWCRLQILGICPQSRREVSLWQLFNGSNDTTFVPISRKKSGMG